MVGAKDRSRVSQLVAVNSDGARPPVWSVHPIGGSVLWLSRLAAHLPRDQPLYGIQARGIDGEDEPLRSIPEMASAYLTAIREVQPEGPFLLSGASFGGTVAYEMAQQLRDADQEVALLALFDTFGPQYPRRAAWPTRVVRVLEKLHGLPWRPRAAFLWAKWRERPGDSLTRALSDLSSSPIVRGVQRVIAANSAALRRYRPRRCDGTIVLFRATVRPPEFGEGYEDPTNGWSALAPCGVDVIPVEGDHRFLLDPPAVDELARKFAVSIRRAHNRASTTASRHRGEAGGPRHRSSDRHG